MMHTARTPAMVSMVIILFHLHLNQAGVSAHLLCKALHNKPGEMEAEEGRENG